MSSQTTADAGGLVAPLESTRRRLTPRQAEVVTRLTAAALDELRTSGYDGLTVRNVARRAGVAPATAYTYFGSKDHLVAEVFWRKLAALPAVRVDRRRSPSARVGAALHDIGRLISDEPQLAAACTAALLAHDADVQPLRERIGALWHQRLKAALGADATPQMLQALELSFSGALLQAGMGHLAYEDVTELMVGVADVVFGGRS
jgi:AcrR family transcriptional regulator